MAISALYYNPEKRYILVKCMGFVALPSDLKIILFVRCLHQKDSLFPFNQQPQKVQ